MMARMAMVREGLGRAGTCVLCVQKRESSREARCI